MAGGARESPSHQPLKSWACYNPRLCKSMHGCAGAAAWPLPVERLPGEHYLAHRARATAGNFFPSSQKHLCEVGLVFAMWGCNPGRKINIP